MPEGGSGDILRLFVDVYDIMDLASQARGDAAKVNAAATEAHRVLASSLQRFIAKALIDKVEQTNRPQREYLLYHAILNEQNRRAGPYGFQVGFLDQGWAGEVRKYYRGLEIGTAVHVGRYLRGMFLGPEGLVPPERNAKDARFIQFKNPKGPLMRDGTFVTRAGNGGERPRRIPGVLIKKPIKPYHYTRTGFSDFREAGYLGDRAMEVYNDAFAHYGMRLRIRNANRGGIFGPGSINFASSGLNARPIPKELGR